jgi:hypothetical protein
MCEAVVTEPTVQRLQALKGIINTTFGIRSRTRVDGLMKSLEIGELFCKTTFRPQFSIDPLRHLNLYVKDRDPSSYVGVSGCRRESGRIFLTFVISDDSQFWPLCKSYQDISEISMIADDFPQFVLRNTLILSTAVCDIIEQSSLAQSWCTSGSSVRGLHVNHRERIFGEEDSIVSAKMKDDRSAPRGDLESRKKSR